jgi:hypothetical protein
MQESVTFQQDSYQDKNRPPSPKASPKVQKSPKTASAASRSRFFGKRGSMSHIETREDSGQSSLSGQERFERYLSPYPGRRIRTTSTGSDKSNLNVNASGKAPRVTSFDDDEADGFDDNDSDKEEEDEGADHGLIELVPILVVLFGCAWHSPPFFLFPVKCRDMHTYIHTHTHTRARARAHGHTHTHVVHTSFTLLLDPRGRQVLGLLVFGDCAIHWNHYHHGVRCALPCSVLFSLLPRGWGALLLGTSPSLLRGTPTCCQRMAVRL